MKVMIVVTHLLGTGHLARALTLGRAFSAAGDDVTLVSGGAPVPHFDTHGVHLVQLPALRSDGTDFTRLLDANGAVADGTYRRSRIDRLRATLHDTQPEVLITELFPFGRRNLRDEFAALLHAARDLIRPPLTLSSVRDILAPPSKPAKAAFAEGTIDAFYDGVLVHSDPALVSLDLSWPVSEALRPRLRYTGFVAPDAPGPSRVGQGEVLVSAGGGDVGQTVFTAACDAARQRSDLTWRLLVGGTDARRSALRSRAPRNVIIEAPRPDFRDMLTGAAASVSMCGYNTAMDVLQTGVPAVMIPFDDGGEVEQGLRAAALAKLPALSVLDQANLTGNRLAEAVRTVRIEPQRAPKTDGMSGARDTVRMVHDMLREGSG